MWNDPNAIVDSLANADGDIATIVDTRPGILRCHLKLLPVRFEDFQNTKGIKLSERLRIESATDERGNVQSIRVLQDNKPRLRHTVRMRVLPEEQVPVGNGRQAFRAVNLSQSASCKSTTFLISS